MAADLPDTPSVINVLVVDDDRISRLRLICLIRQFGHVPHEAASGEEALGLFAETAIDVVLMDVMMPGISGFETAARMKGACDDRWLPIIFLSAVDERASRDSWIEFGDDFMAKPMDIQLLQARLRSMTKAIFHERRAKLVAAEMAKEQRLARGLMERIAFQHRTLEFTCIQTRSASASISSGDCMVVEGNAEHFYVLMADAMGHGLAAAVTLQPAISIFRSMAAKAFSPQLIAREINQKLREMLPRGRFISVAIAEINRQTMDLRLFNAGLPAIYLVGIQGEIRAEYPSCITPLGVVDDTHFTRQGYSTRFDAGESLLLFSDGFSEAFGDSTKAVRDGIASVLLAADGESQLEQLWDVWKTGATSDDASLLRIGLEWPVEEVVVPIAGDSHGERKTLARVTLLPEQLKRSLGAGEVQGVLGCLGLNELAQDQKLAVIISELLSNALDYGLLHLDSSLKDGGVAGWNEYYRLRDERLSALCTGFIGMEVRSLVDDGRYEIDVKDSGDGFDWQTRTAADFRNNEASKRGRGLLVLQTLADSVEYFDGGCRTVVTTTLNSGVAAQ